MTISVWALDGIREITAGDNLVQLVGDAIGEPQSGDIVVISSKIVSKAEGRSIAAADRESAITAETVRVVASREHAGGVTRIVENHLGLVMAAAGVDASNTPDGTVLLLPLNPDASALDIAQGLRDRFGVDLGVVITDTFGRPWRLGQTDAAIGCAGIRVVDDLRGTNDSGGRRLDATVTAVADEIAAAADLVKGKANDTPVAVVRGLGRYVVDLSEPGARILLRSAVEDLFRLGSAEAFAEGFSAGRASLTD